MLSSGRWYWSISGALFVLLSLSSNAFALDVTVTDQMVAGPQSLVPLNAVNLVLSITLQQGESINVGDFLEIQMTLQNADPAEFSFFRTPRPFRDALLQGPSCSEVVTAGSTLCENLVFCLPGTPECKPAQAFHCTFSNDPISGRPTSPMPNGQICQEAIPSQGELYRSYFFIYSQSAAGSQLLPLTAATCIDIGYFGTTFRANMSGPPFAYITLPTVTLYDQSGVPRYTSVVRRFGNGARPVGSGPVVGSCPAQP